MVDESKVPRDFLAVDDSAVKSYIKQAGKNEPISVPGIRFFKDTSVRART